MKNWFRAMGLAGVVLLATPLVATAAGYGPAAVREQVESSMLVRGEVQIETDGTVSAVTLHREEKLPRGVVTLVREAALQWRFEPIVVEGAVVKAIAPMSLRVIARKGEGDSFEVALRGLNFQRFDSEDPQNVASLDMPPPRYPEQAWRTGASGDVYLLVRVGRNGQVEDAFAEQVNLGFLSSAAEQRRFRELFARNAVAAARRWTFRTPTTGETASQPYWNIRVPVSYRLSTGTVPREHDGYGRWNSYVAGPRESAPWRDAAQEAHFSPDTLPEGGVYMADAKGPRLLTPLHGG
ncbi:energy transducer TonB [Stenotrophomonas pictorum]|nr:energy transducer TonB [Stenotrophomonas pictorum]